MALYPYGKHIKALFRSEAPHLESTEVVREFLLTATATAGMRPLGSPVVYNVPLQIEKLGAEPYEDEGGTTGVLVLSTSHCTIHTWPLQKKGVIDLYSCRDFDTNEILKCIESFYDPFETQIHDLSFALDPKDAEADLRRFG